MEFNSKVQAFLLGERINTNGIILRCEMSGKRTITAAILWLTAASTLAAGLPAFDCLCPNGQRKLACLSLTSEGCCCGNNCCPEPGNGCCKTDKPNPCSGCQKTLVDSGFVGVATSVEPLPAFEFADYGFAPSCFVLVPTTTRSTPPVTADTRPLPIDLVITLLRLTI